ncbi:MAG: HAD family hydrolase, partial [Verrucomicrobiota bacterium]
MAYKHIIWDWNGTLIDDTWLCVEVINQIMALRKMPPVNIDSYRAEFGFPVIEYYHKLGFDLEHDPFEEISVEFISEYNRRRMECHL